ncbi:hypothetical protein [Duganella sp. HH101]|uniref:hypothetical protein n=1 Tax=Duganella sp. HH101 TaxID=1781066 RepID=UPI00087402A5|nr:hypothetical protein [Duganella sp. HH101]
MPFNFNTFKTLTGGIHFQASSVDALRLLVDTPAARIGDRATHAGKVKRAMELMPVVKIEKYKKGLAYLIEEYNPLITDIAPAPLHPMHAGERVKFGHGVEEEMVDRGDLLYGLGEDYGRVNRVYMALLFTGPRYADVYNNAVGIGTGTAFGRINNHNRWEGTPTAASVANAIASSMEDLATKNDAHAPMKHAHTRGLMNSRFSPLTVFADTNEVLARNNNRGMGVEPGDALNTALWNKAIRRACKYGLEMVATDPIFTTRGAQVHFVLDGLGDLATVAQKKSLDEILMRQSSSKFVPITSSELCFVFRNWGKLRNIVRFWVNGLEVQAPWLSNWSEPDVSGNQVISGWEAWRRYELKRRIIKGKG